MGEWRPAIKTNHPRPQVAMGKCGPFSWSSTLKGNALKKRTQSSTRPDCWKDNIQTPDRTGGYPGSPFTTPLRTLSQTKDAKASLTVRQDSIEIIAAMNVKYNKQKFHRLEAHV